MNHPVLLGTFFCLLSLGWSQTSPNPAQRTPPPNAAQQREKERSPSPPPPNDASQFSSDSSTCSPLSSDKEAKSPKTADPHARPPSSLPATTAPGKTTPCGSTSGSAEMPAGRKQMVPTNGPTNPVPSPNKQNNTPLPIGSAPQTSGARNSPGFDESLCLGR
jgi:hypothetical protein